MNFNRIAHLYGVVERLTVGNRMQKCRIAQLSSIREARQVLIAGEGTGQFLAACASALPEAHFVVLDESSAMLSLAERKWRNAGGAEDRAEFVQTDLLTWDSGNRKFDTIVTHFFLDCFPPATIAAILEKIASAGTENARWLLADFCEPPTGLARLRARVMLRVAYAIFGFAADVPATRLTSPDRFFERLGYRLTSRKSFDSGMMHSDLWEKNAEFVPVTR